MQKGADYRVSKDQKALVSLMGCPDRWAARNAVNNVVPRAFFRACTESRTADFPMRIGKTFKNNVLCWRAEWVLPALTQGYSRILW
jgi:hypothetical protein